eukprot:Mrub_00699.p1 GENE.Mrub_00699~~Mrub_00699.p1  ORF type:complete len:647 (+),score=190.29 Mrub_00699:866-2806(+)
MRKITYNDSSINKLKDVKNKFEESKDKINKKLQGLVSFLNEEENKTENEITNSFINESKLLDTNKIEFNLEDLKNYDNDPNELYCNNNILNRAGSSTYHDADIQNLYNKINSMQFELDLANKTNEDLQLVIKRVKEDKNYSIEDINKTKEIELQRTKEALQNKSKQQIELIEKLIKEKKVLLNKCEDFTKQLRFSDAKNNQNMQEAEMRFASEVKKLREQWAESEKQRREQFVESKTREIKETTIKGLEPELQRIMRKSKEDLAAKEREFNVNLETEKENMLRNFELKLQEQRNMLLTNKDSEITKERESLSIKLKDNWSLYQQQLKENNDKWREYFENEKDKHDSVRAKDAEKFELKINNLQTDIENIKINNAENLRNLREEYEGRNKASLAETRDKMNLENDEWRSRMLSKFRKEADAELKLTKEQLRRERDIEIEKLIVKMSEEQTSWKKQFEVKSAENEKAIRLKYLDDLKESKRVELDIREQLEQTKEFKLKLEDKITDLNKKILRYEQDKKDTKDAHSKDIIALKNELSELKALVDSKDNKTKQLESEYIRKNNRLELEVEDLRELNNSLKGDYSRSIDNIKEEHQKELETIEISIKKTIEKKNAMIEGLKSQLKNEQEEKENMKSKFDKHRMNLVNALE